MSQRNDKRGRMLEAHRARERLHANLGTLEVELSLATKRRHLDPLLECLDLLLARLVAACGGHHTLETRAFAGRIEDVTRRAELRKTRAPRRPRKTTPPKDTPPRPVGRPQLRIVR